VAKGVYRGIVHVDGILSVGSVLNPSSLGDFSIMRDLLGLVFFFTLMLFIFEFVTWRLVGGDRQHFHQVHKDIYRDIGFMLSDMKVFILFLFGRCPDKEGGQ
jgi:hypothetical protein